MTTARGAAVVVLVTERAGEGHLRARLGIREERGELATLVGVDADRDLEGVVDGRRREGIKRATDSPSISVPSLTN